jgi:hypothetical protein
MGIFGDDPKSPTDLDVDSWPRNGDAGLPPELRLGTERILSDTDVRRPSDPDSSGSRTDGALG